MTHYTKDRQLEVAKALFELSKILGRDLREQVPLTHLHALFRIAVAGVGGIDERELEKKLGFTRSSMSRTERVLAGIKNKPEGDAIVEYVPHPHVEGRTQVRLTANGRALFQEFASRFTPLSKALQVAA